jgi:hypothetical protein
MMESSPIISYRQVCRGPLNPPLAMDINAGHGHLMRRPVTD